MLRDSMHFILALLVIIAQAYAQDSHQRGALQRILAIDVTGQCDLPNLAKAIKGKNVQLTGALVNRCMLVKEDFPMVLKTVIDIGKKNAVSLLFENPGNCKHLLSPGIQDMLLEPKVAIAVLRMCLTDMLIDELRDKKVMEPFTKYIPIGGSTQQQVDCQEEGKIFQLVPRFIHYSLEKKTTSVKYTRKCYDLLLNDPLAIGHLQMSYGFASRQGLAGVENLKKIMPDLFTDLTQMTSLAGTIVNSGNTASKEMLLVLGDEMLLKIYKKAESTEKALNKDLLVAIEAALNSEPAKPGETFSSEEGEEEEEEALEKEEEEPKEEKPPKGLRQSLLDEIRQGKQLKKPDPRPTVEKESEEMTSFNVEKILQRQARERAVQEESSESDSAWGD